MNDKASMQSYQDLKAWQEAMDLAEECYRVTKQFPRIRNLWHDITN
jgi:hypothetical protein